MFFMPNYASVSNYYSRQQALQQESLKRASNDPKAKAVMAITRARQELFRLQQQVWLQIRQSEETSPERAAQTTFDTLSEALQSFYASDSSTLSPFNDMGLEVVTAEKPIAFITSRLAATIPLPALRVTDGKAFLAAIQIAVELANRGPKSLDAEVDKLWRPLYPKVYELFGGLIREGNRVLDFSQPEDAEFNFISSLNETKQAFDILGIAPDSAYYASALEALDGKYLREFNSLEEFGTYPWTVPSEDWLQTYGGDRALYYWLTAAKNLDAASNNTHAKHLVKKVATDISRSIPQLDSIVLPELIRFSHGQPNPYSEALTDARDKIVELANES